MAQIRLIPSTIYNPPGTSILTISNENSAYTNTDSTTYATIQNLSATTTSYYIYIRGFNFSDIPSGASVESFTIKLKAKETGANTSTSYRPRICNGTSALVGESNTISTTVKTITFTGVTATWDTIKGYGDNFSIRVNCRRSNRNNPAYIYLYGAEILVDYTPPSIVEINNHTQISTNPSGITLVKAREDFNLQLFTSFVNNLYMTDNDVEVSDDLLPCKEEIFIPSQYDSGSGNVQNIENGFTDSTSTTYAQTNGQSGHYLSYGFDVSSIPQNAEILSLSCVVKVQHTRSAGYSGLVQLYSGNNAKGDAESFKNLVATINLDTGTWTRDELENIKIRIGNNYTGSTTTYYTRFFGATLTIKYYDESINNPDYYVYRLQSLVTSDRNIEISYAPIMKINGQWQKLSKLFKKENDVWVRKYNFDGVFNGVYIRN